MLYKDIIEETTKTSDIFKILRNYYQFAPSESTFLKFSAIKRETTAGTLERPLHLYLRLRQFIRDNLLLSSGKIQHDGAVPSRDEVLSPTTERLIVLRWLEILHPCLPSHVAHVFAQDLQTKSLKDLQPRINEQIEDLLIQAQNKSEEVNISYAKVSNYTRGGSGPRIFSKFPGKNDVPYRSFRGSNSQGYQKSYENSSPRGGFQYSDKYISKRTPKTCPACRSVGEPFIGHDIQNCKKIPPGDKGDILKTFNLEVLETEDYDTNDNPVIHEDEAQTARIQLCPGQDYQAKVQRVDISESPQFNVKIRDTTVTMLLDTGATGSMINEDLCIQAKLEICPTSHSAVLADGDSRLAVIGEIHSTITMDSKVTLPFNALVVTKLDAGLIAGMSFMRQHGVVIDIPNRALLIQGCHIPFSSQPGNPKVSLCRTEVSRIILPDESISFPVPANFVNDKEIAVENLETSQVIGSNHVLSRMIMEYIYFQPITRSYQS